jgi:alkanesulfonate monooxygenase SsuD/methylene tetrahydromethanopterin reductase-like flavin-dependent oxidoreductase (luciferase family)
MEISIGLPNTIPGVTPDALLEWGRRAEARGFPGVASLDRLVYPGYEPLVSLAAVAAVTERVRLTTQVLLAPWRLNAALVAKQVATVHQLSKGRMVLGIGLGGREDDYAASGIAMGDRGERLTRMLDEILRIWAGEERGTAGAIGPPLDDIGRPEVLVGGGVEASFKRAARFGDGWTAGGVPPDQFAQAAEAVRAAWREAGREGTPRLTALAYYGLGPTAVQDAEHDLKHYYAWLGDELASMIAGSAATDEESVRAYAKAFEDAGCDELTLFPTSTDPRQVDLLADAVGLQAAAGR